MAVKVIRLAHRLQLRLCSAQAIMAMQGSYAHFGGRSMPSAKMRYVCVG